MNTCEFCESKFTQAKNLYAHQRTAEYCLEIRKQKCEFCEERVKELESHCCHQRMIYIMKQNEELKEIIMKKDEELRQKEEELRHKNEVIEKIALKSVEFV